MRAVLRYPGSKWRIADWIINHMPEHHTYIEPYFGSGAVFFKKPPSNIELINDIDGNIVNLYQLIRDDPERLANLIWLTPYARAEYDAAFDDDERTDQFEKARRFLIKCWMGYGSRISRYPGGWKNDVAARERAYALRHWNNLPEWFAEASERLKNTQIDNQPAIDVMKRFKQNGVLIYADPPYLLNTRSGLQYKHEMTNADHTDMLSVLIQHPGPVILSGYDNAIYNDVLIGWEKKAIKSNAEHGLHRIETIWLNEQAKSFQMKIDHIL